MNRTLRAEELTEMRRKKEGIPKKMGLVGKGDRPTDQKKVEKCEATLTKRGSDKKRNTKAESDKD